MKKFLLICCLAVALIVGAIPASMVLIASADTIAYDIGIPNTAISPFPGPYASLDINLIDSTHATLTFTGLTVGDYTYLLGGVGSVAANVNASSFVLDGDITVVYYTGFGTPTKPYTQGSGNVSDFGIFNFTLKAFDGWGYSAKSLSFTLKDTGGTWASASDVLTNNAAGYLAAAHIFVGDLTPAVSDGAIATGFAGNGIPVPEPATLLLLGLGLVGLAGVQRKFKK